MADISERMIELEIRYTHQARLIDELNVELTAANDRIDSLRRDVQMMREMLKGLAPELQESPDE